MRKRIWIPTALILATCILFVLFRPAKHERMIPNETAMVETNRGSAKVADQANQPTLPEQSKTVERSPTMSAPNDSKLPPHVSQTTLEEIQRQALADWQRRIEFYGKVVDEKTNPVADANITLGWSETPSKEGELTASTKSDGEGLFSLHDKRGPSLDIWVVKEGYYASHHGQWGFSYSHGDFSPDPVNPVIFLLRKKGRGTELITSENGMRPNVWVRVSKDNTPVRIDFFQKQASATGQLEISQDKPPWQHATNWSFQLSIPDGGFVENQDEFQFEAPDTNYQTTIEYHFAKGETNWTTQVTKQFYIAFGQPRRYGWLRFESNLAQETVFLTYAINPDGSRNLEPK
jgi:hypothetical protein